MKLEKKAKCQICGKEDETGHHAVVRCSKAKTLRMELKNYWGLPAECLFQIADPDWLLTLLGNLSEEETAKTLLLFWRAWFLRNDVMHEKGTTMVKGSVDFLTSYATTLNITKHAARGDPINKGKKIIHEGVAARSSKAKRYESRNDIASSSRMVCTPCGMGEAKC
jgi:hypothetical protein